MRLPNDCSTSLTASNIVRWVTFLLILDLLTDYNVMDYHQNGFLVFLSSFRISRASPD